ncbi:DUF2889 domain-containing protein [Terasakiella pusilla]|uniref:DUF2889 domain-containing protein n=1 Tax=Terasakiella pusilla TaxID=64973 RepID=UPI003AA88A47
MPLSTPAARKHVHTRAVTFTGYEREDGLFDIEGHLVDTKTYSFPNQDRGEIKAGEPIHNMRLRLTVDEEMIVRAVEAVLDDSPFNLCCTITPAFKVLEGMLIGPGWNRRVREKLGGTKGCTHLVEMLAPIATATYQTLYPILKQRREAQPEDERDKPSMIDGCHVMDSSGPLIKERWPEYYKKPEPVS